MVCGVWQRMQELHREARAAVADQRVVAVVADRGRNDGAGDFHRRTVGHEVEDVVGYLCPFVLGDELAQVSPGGDADGVGDGGVEGGGRLGLERVGVVAVGILGENAPGIVGRLNLRRVAVQGRFRGRGGVGDILFLAGRNVGGDQTHGNRPRRGDAVAIQRQTFGIGDVDAGGDGAILGDGGGDDLDFDARPDEVDEILVHVGRFLVLAVAGIRRLLRRQRHEQHREQHNGRTKK